MGPMKPIPLNSIDMEIGERQMAADRNGLRLIGILFATLTFAVMSTTAFIVKVHADGSYAVEGAPPTGQESKK